MSERQYQAHRLHQFRIEAHLSTDEVDRRAGLPNGTCFAIEYRQRGTVEQIKAILDLFVPGERRMRSIEDGVTCS